MKSYEKYKNTKYDWLGKVPTHWAEQTIRSITNLSDERNGSQEDLQLLSVYREYGVILKESRDDNHNVESNDLSNYKVVSRNDLVLNKMKAWQGSMGVSKYNGIVSPAYIVCKLSNKLAPEYIHYLLRSKPFITEYNRLSYGIRVGQWDMRYDNFKKISLFLPTPTEQEQIVRFLDWKVTMVNKFVKTKKKEIALLKELKQAEINHAVTRGLNPNIPFKDSGIDWIGKVPEHWKVVRLKNFCGFVNRGNTPNYSESGVKVVNQANFSKGIFDEYKIRFSSSSPNDLRGILLNNDILVASTGGGVLGKTLLFTKPNNDDIYVADSHVTIIRDEKQRFTPQYLQFYLSINYDLINGILAQGSTNQIELQREWLRSMYFPLPPLPEQRQIASHIEETEGRINKAITAIEQEIKLAQEYKTRLISDVVTGQIDVRGIEIPDYQFEVEEINDDGSETENIETEE